MPGLVLPDAGDPIQAVVGIVRLVRPPLRDVATAVEHRRHQVILIVDIPVVVRPSTAIAAVKDGPNRSSIPRPLISAAGAQAHVIQLPPRVVMQVVIERGGSGELLLEHLPLRVVEDFIGIGAARSITQIAAESQQRADRLIVAICS